MQFFTVEHEEMRLARTIYFMPAGSHRGKSCFHRLLRRPEGDFSTLDGEVQERRRATLTDQAAADVAFGLLCPYCGKACRARHRELL
ncbi:hypothetical protein DIPPA_53937 [Diplonema papillatum]|nr:hypothetical protein DIPPA_53937 [Diplonema papillatum]